MRSVDLEPLSAEAKSLLAAEREFSPQGAQLRERALARARASLRNAPGPAAPEVGSWRHARLLMVAAIVMVLTAVAFAAWNQQRVVHDAAVGVPSAVGSSEGSTTALSAPIAAEAAPAVEAAGPRALALREKAELASPARPSPSVDAYSLELALLQRARAAVANERFSVALRAIAEHERRFPAGHLREEREALRVKALAGLGRAGEAHRAAEKFREHFPDSVLSPSIEGATRNSP